MRESFNQQVKDIDVYRKQAEDQIQTWRRYALQASKARQASLERAEGYPALGGVGGHKSSNNRGAKSHNQTGFSLTPGLQNKPGGGGDLDLDLSLNDNRTFARTMENLDMQIRSLKDNIRKKKARSLGDLLKLYRNPGVNDTDFTDALLTTADFATVYELHRLVVRTEKVADRKGLLAALNANEARDKFAGLVKDELLAARRVALTRPRGSPL